MNFIREWIYKFNYNRTKPLDLTEIEGYLYSECYPTIRDHSWEHNYKWRRVMVSSNGICKYTDEYLFTNKSY